MVRLMTVNRLQLAAAMLAHEKQQNSLLQAAISDSDTSDMTSDGESSTDSDSSSSSSSSSQTDSDESSDKSLLDFVIGDAMYALEKDWWKEDSEVCKILSSLGKKRPRPYNYRYSSSQSFCIFCDEPSLIKSSVFNVYGCPLSSQVLLEIYLLPAGLGKKKDA